MCVCVAFTHENVKLAGNVCVCVAFTHENVKLAGNVCVCVWLLLMKMLNWLVTCVCVCGFYS